MEEDLSQKAKYVIRYGLIALIAFAAVIAAGIYFYQHHHSYMTIYHAEVKGALVKVNAKTNGTIQDMAVESGDHVEAGDVIAHINVNVTDEDIKNYENAVALAQRNLDEIKKGQTMTVPLPSVPAPSNGSQERLANAAARMQRMNELFAMGAVSASKRDEAAAEYESAQAAASAPPATTGGGYRTVTQPPDPASVKNAELQLKQAQTVLATAKEFMGETEIVAPVSGTVYYDGDMGEGKEVKMGETIASIGNEDDLWVSVPLTPEQESQIHLGQLATYEIDGKTLQGSVQEVQEVESKDTDGEGGGSSSDTDSAGSRDAASSDTSDADADKTDASDSGDGGDSTQVFANISIPPEAAKDIRPGMVAAVKFVLDQ